MSLMRRCTNVLIWVGAWMVAAVGAGAQEDFEWNARMGPGQTLEVIGISGDIRAVRAEGGTAVVTAEKRGRRGDFADVRIEVIEDGQSVVLSSGRCS